MTKLTITPPSEELIAKAQAEVIIHDVNGRAITLKKPGVLAQYHLVELVGNSAKNEVYMGMVLPVIYVAAIDGDAVDFPSTKRELEATIQRLGEEGLDLIGIEVPKLFGKQNPKADKDKIKN